VLGIVPHTVPFDGDPWAYVRSRNGARRDLVAEQRYLIWKYCTEQSEEWQRTQQRIDEKASHNKSVAAQQKPRAEDGLFIHVETPQVEQVVPFVDKEPEDQPHKTRQAKAHASQTNRGAVMRGETLANRRPDLAEHVRTGAMSPAAAYREMKRAEVIEQLEDVEAQEAKALARQAAELGGYRVHPGAHDICHFYVETFA
jgi:hypothetical protein